MKNQPKTRRKPTKESYSHLEARKVLTSVVLNGGQIQIAGDASDNVAIVSLSNDASEYVVSLDGTQTSFDESQVSSIRFRGWNGDDRFVNQTDLASTAFGGLGNDTLTGGTNVDVLNGDDGDDILRGRTGNDIIFGGRGNDQLFGAFGNDQLSGESGDDEIFGSAGLDQISGGLGEDILSGGIGSDEITGDGGDDEISGGTGADLIFGGLGNDTIHGLAGADTIFGDEGNDFISGGSGGDEIQGGLGNDNLSGGSGGDTLIGDGGNDRLFGGDHQDQLRGGTGSDRLFGGAAPDSYFSIDNDFIDLQSDDVITTSLVVESTDTPIPLPDLADVTSFIDVSEDLQVLDVNVQLDITHTYTGDLNVLLTSPAGTTVQLFQREGGGGNNFEGTILDDEATTSIVIGRAPFVGSFSPENPLSTFDGESTAGTWELRIVDQLRIDVGTFNSWSLHFNTDV